VLKELIEIASKNGLQLVKEIFAYGSFVDNFI
jgi:hypothetical protein